jgi:hypothetical protein
VEIPKVADRPHPVSVCLGLLSPLIGVAALFAAFGSLYTSRTAMKVSQRAYLTYQLTVTNMGNTPADSITPKINVVPDPDRSPLMITFPNGQPFDLGPKESRVLTGQALFRHVHNVRQIPSFSTRLTGQIEYKDVFRDSQAKQVCHQFLIENNSASSGACGTIMQILTIK